MTSLICQNLTNIDYFIKQLKLILPLINKLIELYCSKPKEEWEQGKFSDRLNLFDLRITMASGLDCQQSIKPQSPV